MATLDDMRKKYVDRRSLAPAPLPKLVDSIEAKLRERAMESRCPSCGDEAEVGLWEDGEGVQHIECASCLFAFSETGATAPNWDKVRVAVASHESAIRQKNGDAKPLKSRSEEIAETMRSKAHWKHAKYLIDGDEVTIQFGRHRGKKLSEMAGDREMAGYLRWMLKEEFPDDLKEEIRKALGLPPGS